MGIAQPARFAPDPQRRALIAKIHIAPKQLGMDEDSYRAVLRRVTGQLSAGSCDLAQLQALVAAFTRLGFRATAAAKGKGRPVRRADHPVARKARAMWISLGYLCAIRDPSEAALEGFARRQLGCETFQWANQSQADRLIEALKAIAERHGWNQSLKGLGKEHHVHALKMWLAAAILAKLKRAGLASSHWQLGEAAWKLCTLADPDQYRFEGDGELDRINAALGAVLRVKGGDDAFEPLERAA